MVRPPLGIADFRKVRTGGYLYVDKTDFVANVIEDPAEVILFTRPRRFGKTLAQSTLRAFLGRPANGVRDAEDLFDGLAVRARSGAWEHAQRYPVVFLSFKDVKQTSLEDALGKLRRLIANAYREHWPLVEAAAQLPGDAESVRAITNGTASRAEYEGALFELTRYVHAATGEPVVVLIDEYDTPLHAALLHGYYDELTSFLRNLLSAALKDNTVLFKGVLTGVMRVAQEGMFSGLNNIRVYSVLDSPSYADAFGFTQEEVVSLLAQTGMSAALAEVCAWYDGYTIGGSRLYTPWSVLSFCQAPSEPPKPYWVFSGGDDLLRAWLLARGRERLEELTSLLAGDTIRKSVDAHLALSEVHDRADAVWSLLLHAGYLTATAQASGQSGWNVEMAIPNREVRVAFERSVLAWAEAGPNGGERLERVSAAMLAGDEEAFGALLGDLVRETLSFHDVAGAAPERVYQAFVLGLFVHLAPEYEVISNREVGFGRVDVLVLPRSSGRPAAVLELKRSAPEQVESALDAALEQIATRRYVDAARARGADPVLSYAVVFDGKRVNVRRGREP